MDPSGPGHLYREHGPGGTVPVHFGQQTRGVQETAVLDQRALVRGLLVGNLGLRHPVQETGHDGSQQFPVAVQTLEKRRPERPVFGHVVEPPGPRVGATQHHVRAVGVAVRADGHGGQELGDGWLGVLPGTDGPSDDHRKTPDDEAHGRDGLGEVVAAAALAAQVRRFAQRPEALGRGLGVRRRVHQLGVDTRCALEERVHRGRPLQALGELPEVRARVRVVRERQPDERVQVTQRLVRRPTDRAVRQHGPPEVQPVRAALGRGQFGVAHDRVQGPVQVVRVALHQPVRDRLGGRVRVRIRVRPDPHQVRRRHRRADDRFGHRVHVVQHAAVQQIIVQPVLVVLGVRVIHREKARAPDTMLRHRLCTLFCRALVDTVINNTCTIYYFIVVVCRPVTGLRSIGTEVLSTSFVYHGNGFVLIKGLLQYHVHGYN